MHSQWEIADKEIERSLSTYILKKTFITWDYVTSTGYGPTSPIARVRPPPLCSGVRHLTDLFLDLWWRTACPSPRSHKSSGSFPTDALGRRLHAAPGPGPAGGGGRGGASGREGRVWSRTGSDVGRAGCAPPPTPWFRGHLWWSVG